MMGGNASYEETSNSYTRAAHTTRASFTPAQQRFILPGSGTAGIGLRAGGTINDVCNKIFPDMFPYPRLAFFNGFHLCLRKVVW